MSATEAPEDWRPIAVSVALMLAGIVLLDCMAAIAKHLVQRYPAQQISIARNVFGLLPTVSILLWETRGQRAIATVRLRQWPLALSRGLMVACAQLAFYYSFIELELATAVVLAYCGPLFITVLAIPWLGERVGPWRLGAVIGGFVGVMLIMRPGTDLFTWFALLPVIAAFCYANSLVATRRFDPDASNAAINVYAQAGAIVGSVTLFLITADAVSPSGTRQLVTDLAWAVLLGGCGGLGVYFLTLAYRRTPASLLAPFEYFGVLSALAVGWLVFNEWPVARIFPGVLFIIGAGLVIVFRTRRRARRPSS